jgi:hypothetical protein
MQVGSAGAATLNSAGSNDFIDETGTDVTTITLGGAGKTITLVVDGSDHYTVFGKS